MENNFYVYEYIREDGTPYYIGKGSGNRAYVKRKRGRPIDAARIRIIKEALTELEALELEVKLIKYYGRKDLGTGFLINLTNGGEGLANPSTETRMKMAAAKRNESIETRHKRSVAAKKRIRTALSEETKKKISNANNGKKRTIETKEKMALAKFGKPSYLRTIETKLKQSKPKEKVGCPHCGKVGGVSVMTRWHFKNCKFKGNI
jgi:hypothetical protein